MNRPASDVLDPVAAYDRVAPFFSDISGRRKRYLDSINELTVARIPSGSHSLLDVGAGDGKRVRRIARQAGLQDIVLLEPSAEMMKDSPNSDGIWKIRVEDVGRKDGGPASRRFDVVTCLWNVLGHIRPAKMRVQVLRELGRLLTHDGRLFLDVNHRYNVRSYGLVRTAGRFLYDKLLPSEANGDVTVSWNFGDVRCHTYGHVFTDREIRQLAREADLTVTERVVVDYETGGVKPRAWEGNLFYVFRRRNSASDSCNVSQTSCTSASVI
jgi:2-polyprenyl-3-methyl-5-hydroxy-6-metoxy-1,4-benzoquinol methylase